MGTFVAVTLYDTHLDRDRGERIIDSMLAEIRRIESAATDYDDAAVIARVNEGAGKTPVRVTREIVDLLRESDRCSRRFGGAFDVTVGPLVRLWDFMAESPSVPEPDKIRSLLPLVDYRLVQIRGDSIYLPRKGMRLDLGAIAKGYAVDKALEAMLKSGATRGIVDLGGNLGIAWDGTRLFDSTAVTVYVRHPRREGAMFGHFRLGAGGISTSGDYQRFFIRDSVRYHHILDPHSGWPARDVVSVTVVAPTAMEADELSTSAFVLGREEGMNKIEAMPDVEAIFIYEAGDSLAYDLSSGFRGRFIRTESSD
jgi:thiamine biosynthesis lipoprotein